jgi:SAM-dependent methyltransferase
MAPNSDYRWEIAQKLEKTCWENIREKVNSEEYLEKKTHFWRKVLRELPPEIKLDENTRILDVGCGPSGILLAIDSGELYGLDSLMDYYLRSFPHLLTRNISWIKGRIENFAHPEKFDLVFMMNTLDHTFNPEQAIHSIKHILRAGGYVVVTVNCHNYKVLKWYFEIFNRFVDAYHPFQYTARDIKKLFKDFKLVKTSDISDYLLELAMSTPDEVTQKDDKSNLRLAVLLRRLSNPFNSILDLLELMGLPRHKSISSSRSIFTHRLFVFKN